MTEAGPGSGAANQMSEIADPGRRAVIGEALRRLLLRPESTSVAALVILFCIFTALSPDLFPTKLTYISITSFAAELGIVSIGVTLLMIGGHFDLSVGAVLGLTSYVATELMREAGWTPILAAPAAVLIGAALGAVNGVLVVAFRIHSFVVTLGTMLIWRGVVIALTGGFPITVDLPPLFRDVMSGPVMFGFRTSVAWFFAIGAAGTFLLVRTRFGNWIQARGRVAMRSGACASKRRMRSDYKPMSRRTWRIFSRTPTRNSGYGAFPIAIAKIN